MGGGGGGGWEGGGGEIEDQITQNTKQFFFRFLVVVVLPFCAQYSVSVTSFIRPEPEAELSIEFVARQPFLLLLFIGKERSNMVNALGNSNSERKCNWRGGGWGGGGGGAGGGGGGL